MWEYGNTRDSNGWQGRGGGIAREDGKGWHRVGGEGGCDVWGMGDRVVRRGLKDDLTVTGLDW